MLPKEKQINNKAQLKEWLDAELPGYKIRGRRYCLLQLGEKRILHNYAFLLRHHEYYLNTGRKIRAAISLVMLKRLQDKFGIRIPPNVFGKGLSIAHSLPVIVNPGAQVGEYCRLHAFVCIGTAKGYAYKAPTIGDHAYIGPGVKMFGDIKLADRITIGANAVVTKSFEESDSTIAGVPAKVIKRSDIPEVDSEV